MEIMEYDRFVEIFDDTETVRGQGDTTFLGLSIISKYSKEVIGAAEHDKIYSEEVEVLIEKGITEDEVRRIASLPGWHYDEEYQCLAAFV